MFYTHVLSYCIASYSVVCINTSSLKKFVIVKAILHLYSACGITSETCMYVLHVLYEHAVIIILESTTYIHYYKLCWLFFLF